MTVRPEHVAYIALLIGAYLLGLAVWLMSMSGL